MADLIDRQAAIKTLEKGLPSEPLKSKYTEGITVGFGLAITWIEQMPSAQPERKKDIIQKFHDYQVEWLKSHYDIEVEPQLEEMIVRFLHDTANCYMMEVEHG